MSEVVLQKSKKKETDLSSMVMSGHQARALHTQSPELPYAVCVISPLTVKLGLREDRQWVLQLRSSRAETQASGSELFPFFHVALQSVHSPDLSSPRKRLSQRQTQWP